ncbi:flagellar motor protein MotB [Sphingomonas sp. KC8]|uniref:flagellar motor protein MotB n=1 Tax=Sphingomonas sp. KC8 TaxID=1030157 RepID=UPI0002488AC0|nr:flagellar motor protein MotB [Sphingomonas sp. KC8]ARS28981.1 OmpA/MotB domain-containing protein [Sphingomonas sp. KC8]
MASGQNEGLAPIVIRKVRKHKPHAHHGGAWKVAYADFVTAMMAFFMLLWLLANPNKAQLKGLAEYFSPQPAKDSPAATLTTAPGSQPGLGGRGRRAQAADTTSVGQPSAEAGVNGAARGGTANVPEAALRVLADELTLSLEKPPESPDQTRSVRTESSRDGLRVHLVDSANRSMFRGPTAELNDYARQLLTRLARKLAKTGAQVAIEGHTDSSGGQSDANWRLSGDRALAARSAMIAAGLSADRFSEVVAKAGSEPIYPDRPDRPENRRITIVIMAAAPALPQDASFKF